MFPFMLMNFLLIDELIDLELRQLKSQLEQYIYTQ